MKRAWAMVGVAFVGLQFGGCDGTSTDRDAVIQVVEAGRAALLEGHVERACGLLTDEGRRRALEYRVDFDQTPRGSLAPDDPRVPQTCEEIVRREAAAARLPSTTWDEALRTATFDVVTLSGREAEVALRFPTPQVDVRIDLTLTEDGWRIDDSSAIPSGH